MERLFATQSRRRGYGGENFTAFEYIMLHLLPRIGDALVSGEKLPHYFIVTNVYAQSVLYPLVKRCQEEAK